MKNDTVSDFIARIKNAYLARHKKVEVRSVKTIAAISKILSEEGYIGEVKTETKDKNKFLVIELIYKNRKPAIEDIKRVSKPGFRVYVAKTDIPRVLGGIGHVIISTPEGVMTGHSAKKKKIGGEVICKVW